MKLGVLPYKSLDKLELLPTFRTFSPTNLTKTYCNINKGLAKSKFTDNSVVLFLVLLNDQWTSH